MLLPATPRCARLTTAAAAAGARPRPWYRHANAMNHGVFGKQPRLRPRVLDPLLLERRVAVTARSTPACQNVVGLSEQRATARIAVGAGSGEISVYLLDGHLVGVRANDDTSVLLDRLRTKGLVHADRARQLQAMQSMSMPILGRDQIDPILSMLVEEVDASTFEPIIRERFEENIARFVGNRGAPRVEPGTLPWAFNLLIGQDTLPLIERAARSWDLAQTLEESRVLALGTARPTEPAQVAVVRLVAAGPTTAKDAAAATGLEAVSARATIARMIMAGMLADAPEMEERAGGLADASPEDEMEAFSGSEDRHRGGARGGTFVTDRRNLDRVELEPAEDGGARETSYSAPTLSEPDAKEKIDVANEVLAILTQAIDEDRGGARGGAVIQILVDGRPRQYIPLFDGVRIGTTGVLPASDLIANLRRRPGSEQRRMLNQGLLDLLDRALDKAADELEEGRFDDVLSKVMGYRQRMGL